MSFVPPPQFKGKIDELSRNIDFEKLIEKGASGTVLLGRNRILNKTVVVKFYYWKRGEYLEPQRLAKLDCPEILKVFDAGPANDPSDNYAYYVTEHCSLGDVEDYLAAKKLGPTDAIDRVSDVARGISYLHSNGMVHRDLKPENVYVNSEGKFVIGDFGSVLDIGDKESIESSSKHTILFRPPEGFSSIYMRQSDIYQLGMLLFRLLGGFLPYDGHAWLSKKELADYQSQSGFDAQIVLDGALQKRVTSGKLVDLGSIPPWCGNEQIRRFIRKATHPDPHQRFVNSADFLAALHKVRARSVDWKADFEFAWCDVRGTTYKIPLAGNPIIQKRRTGNWQVVRSFDGSTLAEAVAYVSSQ